MSYEMIFGLQVSDEESYARYRAGMTPMLEKIGGAFRYDMRVSEVLKAEGGASINRLFVIAFPSKEVADNFFTDPAYQAVKEEHFKAAVLSSTRVADYTLE